MNLRRAALVALSLAVLAHPAAAQDVTLTSRDGSVEVAGTLLGYDGEFYRVETEFGPLTVDGEGVLCDGPGCPEIGGFVAQFAISGSRTMSDVLVPALITAFAARRGQTAQREMIDNAHSVFHLTDAITGITNARITLRASTTDEGFADLIADEADIALALRPVRAAEASLARDAGIGDLSKARRARIVALDGMVAVVAPENRITALSPQVIANVFAGETANWQELGGPDAPIALHLRDARAGLSQAFDDTIMAAFEKTPAPGIQRHATNAALSDAVAADPFAIGITSYSAIGKTRPLALRGACGIILSASIDTIKSDDYPLNFPLLLYTPARRLPLIAREFLTFLDSVTADLVIRRSGFVDQGLALRPISAQGERLKNAIAAAGEDVALGELQRLVGALGQAARLSATFRFEGGSTELDAPSRAYVLRLAREIESGLFDGQHLIFTGFSDSDGAPDLNLRLSLRRADKVLSAVKSAAASGDFSRLKLSTEAFGEALPVACDDSDWGRRSNRRVEVWLQ